jgi:hypothetical protein
MNPENFNYFQSRVSKFISGSSSRPLFGGFGSSKVTRFSRFIPKRSVPSQVLSTPSTSQDDAEVSRGVVPSLGRLTLNLEVVNNNLDRIKDIIINDYKENQETNRKEIDDYRKRIANRGRIFGRRELGDKKSDVLGAVRKYVGSFFSGTGGAIRALSAFNLLQGLLTGDPSKIIGPLLGIGLTYLPAIGAGIAGAVATSLIGKLFGGGGRAAAGAAQGAGAAAGAGRLGGLARFGGKAALLGGGLALASSIFNNPQADTQQQRLEDLTQQQKGLTEPQSLVPIPQDELKRFENLNRKFEEALDFLLKKQKEQPAQRSAGTGGGGPVPTPISDPNISQMTSLTGIHKQAADIIAGYESASSGGYNAMNRGTGGDSPEGSKNYLGKNLTDMSIGEVIDLQSEGRSTLNAAGRYQFVGNTLPSAMQAAGLKPSDKFSPLNQDKMFVATLKERGAQTWTGSWGLGKYSQEQLDIIERARITPVSPLAPQLPPPAATSPPRPRPIDQQPQRSPEVSIVPFTVPSGQSSASSNVAEANDSTPSIDTTNSENFLALYSKLTYQIV